MTENLKEWKQCEQANSEQLFSFSSFYLSYQHCFICRPSDSTVSEDAGIEPRAVATLALTVRRDLTARLDLIRKTAYTIQEQNRPFQPPYCSLHVEQGFGSVFICN